MMSDETWIAAHRLRDVRRDLDLLFQAMEARRGTLLKVLEIQQSRIDAAQLLNEAVEAVQDEIDTEWEVLQELDRLRVALAAALPDLPEDEQPKLQ